MHVSIVARVIVKTLRRMVATRKQKQSEDEDKRKRDKVPSLPNSTTKTGSRGSGTAKAPRKLAFDDAEHDRSDANSDAALAMPADAGPEALAFIAAMQSKMEQLQQQVAALKGPRPQIDDDDDDAQGFEAFEAFDDDASSPAPLIVPPSLALSREVNQLFEALAKAKQRRLWSTHKVAQTLESLHVVARQLSRGNGVASQLRTRRLGLTETLRRQLSRAAFVDDDEAPGWIQRGCASAAECYDGSSKDFGRRTVREAWWRAFKTPYDGTHVFEPLEKSKWCKCSNCVVGYAAETPRTLFCAVDGFTDSNYPRDVRAHHDQITALTHSRRCQQLFSTSGMVPDMEEPVPVEMPTEPRCLVHLAHALNTRAQPLEDAFRSLQRPFDVLCSINTGGRHQTYTVLALADEKTDSSILICPCDVRQLTNCDCTAAAARRLETAHLQYHTEDADNANVRVWELRTDSKDLAKYLYDPVTGRFYRRLVRTKGIETSHEELKPYVAGVDVGDVFPDLIVESPGSIRDDYLCFNVAGGDLKITSVEKVEEALDPRVLRAKKRSGESKPADVLRPAEPYYPQGQSEIKGYALTYMIMCPDACRYATIDHILGDRADHSFGMLHSVSTSENTRIERMVRAKGGYAAVQRLYAATFPAPPATA